MKVVNYILIFTIGPVQSFIAEARRTADLYAGSDILSQLSAAAAKTIQAPHQLIFPHPATLQKKMATPNKLVAVLQVEAEQNGADVVKTIAENAQKAAEKCWHNMTGDALMQLGLQDSKFHPLWERQKNNFLEFHWVALPVEGDYTRAYREANEALDARKRVRLFNQSPEEELKDSLSGQRQALRTNKEDAQHFWARIAQRPHERRVKEHERLDTIAAVKRFGIKSDSYPSVSTIAGMDFVLALDHEDKKSLMGKIYATGGLFYTVTDFGRGFTYDGDLLYTNTYKEKRLASNYGQAEVDVHPITEELKRLYKKVGFVPSPYYAILVMDADKMGQHLEACRDKEQHQTISQRLSAFAEDVEDVVKSHHGSLVYAGGDDVLAFLPLSTALRTAHDVNGRFGEIFTDWQELGQEFPFTMSAGIAVVHHMAPLDWALSEARAAEKVAKNQYGRNAIVVRLLKRSGDSKQMGGRWETVKLVNELQNYFKEEKLSSRMAHDLLAQAEVTTAVSLAHSPLIKLMLKRHKTKDRRIAFTEAELEQLINEFSTWVIKHELIVPPKEEVKQGLTELGLWLTFARFMAQGGQDE
jgi:CRISPR-associated protein Cmr2